MADSIEKRFNILKAPIDFKKQMAKARRIQILIGTVQVFSQKDFHQAATKEVSKAVEVAEGTIYNYFDVFLTC